MQDNPHHEEADNEPEHHSEDVPVGALCREEGGPVFSSGGDTGGAGRVKVEITCYLTRPVDPCNINVTPKYIVDGLRYSSILRGDGPQDIDLRIRQIKVATLKEEGTRVKIAPI